VNRRAIVLMVVAILAVMAASWLTASLINRPAAIRPVISD
jgi:hypothetical protein